MIVASLFELFFCATLTTCLLIICFLMGGVITFFAKGLFDTPIQLFFRNLLIGCVTCISLYAILITGGRSVFLLSLIIPIHYIVSGYSHPVNPRTTFQWPSLVMVLSVAGVMFFSIGYSYYTYYFDFSAGEYRMPHTDFYVYAQLAAMLKSTGVESVTNRFISFGAYSDANSPYHYLDLYPAALISSVSGITTIKAYLCVVKPFFAVLSFIGFVSVAEHFATKLKWHHWVLSFLALFFCGFLPTQEYILSVWGNLGMFVQNAFNGKVEFYTPFVVILFLSIWQQKYKGALYAVIILMLANFVFVPALFAGTLATLGVIVLYKRMLTRQLAMGIVTILVVGILLVLFYRTSAAVQSSESISLANILKHWSTRQVKGLLVDNVIKLLLLFFPFIPLVWLSIRNKPNSNKSVLLLFVCMATGTGLILWAVNYYFYNSFQFSILITAIAFNVGCFFLVLEQMTGTSRVVRILSVSTFVICVSLTVLNFQHINFYISKEPNLPPAFIDNVTKHVRQLPSSKGIVLVSYEDGDLKTIDYNHYMAGIYLAHINDQLVHVPYYFNLPTDIILEDPAWNYQASPLYNFAHQTKRKNEQALQAFIDEKDISYIVTKSKYELPEFIKARSLTTIESKELGEVFVVLK